MDILPDFERSRRRACQAGKVDTVWFWTSTCIYKSFQVYHGDIKTENVLVTSWNWVFLVDFASYKPTYLPEVGDFEDVSDFVLRPYLALKDDPADFSFFFDTSLRRSCYVAPERFYQAGTEIDQRIVCYSLRRRRLWYIFLMILVEKAGMERSEKRTHAWNGHLLRRVGMCSWYLYHENVLTSDFNRCVIAELFLEGTSIFSLSQLFKYKSGEYSPDATLDKIEDEPIRVHSKL